MANMLSLTEVKQERQEWLDKADAVLQICKDAKRDPTEEEMLAVEECTAAVDKIDLIDLPRAQKIHDTMARKVAHTDPGQPTPQLGNDGASMPVISFPRHQPVQNFKGVVNGKCAEERSFLFGHWMLHTMSQQIPRFDFPESTRICQERGIMNVAQTNVNSDAGVFVPEQFGMDLVLLRETFGVARRQVEVVQMDSDTRIDPRWVSGLTAFFVGESAAGTESDAAWDSIRLVAKDMMVLTRMSAQLSADSAISYGDTLVGEIAYAMANLEDTVAFVGVGSSTHGGIIGINTKLQDVDLAGTDSFGLNTQGTGTTWGAIVIGDFHDTIGLCPQYSLQRNPVWICSTTFYHTVMAPLAIAQAGGATITEAGASVGTATTGAQFLGFPVVFSQVFPTATAVTTVSAIFGTMAAGIRLGDRQQESILFSEHASVGGQSVFERNQIAIRGTERLDIVAHGAGNALATVAGPIVGLQTGT